MSLRRRHVLATAVSPVRKPFFGKATVGRFHLIEHGGGLLQVAVSLFEVREEPLAFLQPSGEGVFLGACRRGQPEVTVGCAESGPPRLAEPAADRRRPGKPPGA